MKEFSESNANVCNQATTKALTNLDLNDQKPSSLADNER
jgi:hypothetical protein